MNLEDWRGLIGYWTDAGHNIQHLDVPPHIATQLDIELPKETTMETETQTGEEGVSQTEPMGGAWKKKKYFDGTKCGLKDCNHKPDGYICDIKPTKAPQGQLWFGPALPCWPQAVFQSAPLPVGSYSTTRLSAVSAPSSP